VIDLELAQKRSETLKALGHPVRLRIVELLNEEERCVGDIARTLDLGSAIVSQQLKILRLSGLVKADRRNGHSFYSLAIAELSRLLECLVSCDQH
jgi:ArsR family transcriptional regulator, lead/cadmium/zinc/bismuth-responsive transcriptional repressor